MALLALAGAMKVVNAAPTGGALRVSGLPGSPTVVRVLGLAELLVGLIGLLFGGGWIAAMAAGFYLAFALFVVNALSKRLPISSCGCLGATETPPTRLHVIVNIAAVAVLGLSSAFPLDPWATLTGVPREEAIPMLLFSGVIVYLLYALLAVLPLRHAARRSSPIMLTTPSRPSRS